MSERAQILFMQTRLIRLASEKWGISIIQANDIFAEYHILEFIEDCFDEFHMEGDDAVLYEIEILLKEKGAKLYAGTN